MKTISFLAFLLIFTFATPAYAQTAADFSDEGLGDEDLTVDLAAEALPTTNGLAYGWERLRSNIQSIFTFNAERKAALYRLRLHRLDRKLAACAEIGDQECVAKVEEHSQNLEQRTEKYIAKRQELEANFQDRFLKWRENRQARAVQWRQHAAERQSQRQELLQQRQENRQQAIKNRQQNRQNTADQRQRNREHLIEMRSQNLKDKLDAARQRADEHQQNLEQAIEATP